MIRIAIVEDDEATYRKHRDYIKKYASETGEQFDTVWFRDGDEITADYNHSYDIIFLDIQMKRVDGMKAAEYIRKLDKEVILIFITNMAQYAIKGYAVNALDFLLKPVPYFAFSEQLKKSIERVQSRKASYILIQADKGLIRLNLADILFLESDKHRIIVHTRADDYSFFGTMKDMEGKFAAESGGENFFRCNSGYLVNLAWVVGIQDSMAIVGKHTLPISRPKKKAFLEALAEYVGGISK